MRLEIPAPQDLRQQEGLQLGEASFHDYTNSIMMERTGLTSKQRTKDEPHCDQKQAQSALTNVESIEARILES